MHGLCGDREKSWSSVQNEGILQGSSVETESPESETEGRHLAIDGREMDIPQDDRPDSIKTHPSRGQDRDKAHSPDISDQETPRAPRFFDSQSAHSPKIARKPGDRMSGSYNGKDDSWLQEYLPNYLPNARVSSYGYAMNGEGVSADEIKEKADELLHALEKLDEVHSPFLARQL